MEHVEVGQLLAGGREHDRLAGQRRDGQRGATSRVTVELGQHHAVVADAVEERLGGRDRVLADHRVNDEQHFVRFNGVPDGTGLRHHLRVDAQPAGGVDDDHVVLGPPRLLQGAASDRDRVAHAIARGGREHRHAGALAEHLELLHRVGPLQVAGDEQRGVALLLQPQRELAGERRLTGPLEAREHDHGRRGLGEPQPPRLAAEDGDELLVDDLDDLLGRVQCGRDFLAAGPLLDRRDELPHHGQRDVRLEQGDADLARGGVNVGGGQPPLPAQRGEDLGQPVR